MVEGMDGLGKKFLKHGDKTKSVERKESKWNSLKKNWKGYKINHRKKDHKEAKKYAKKILKLQKELGLKQSVFMETRL